MYSADLIRALLSGENANRRGCASVVRYCFAHCLVVGLLELQNIIRFGFGDLDLARSKRQKNI